MKIAGSPMPQIAGKTENARQCFASGQSKSHSRDMSHYIRVLAEHPTQVWWIDNVEARQVGIGDAKKGTDTHFRAEPNETIWEAIQRLTSGFFENGQNPFHVTSFAPGEFYPRIARPPLENWSGYDFDASEKVPIELNVVAVAQGQLSALTRQLARICQTVHPQGQGLDTFGHDIRNLLILACTEVEAHWRGVLKRWPRRLRARRRA